MIGLNGRHRSRSNTFLSLLVTTTFAYSGDDSFHGFVRQVDRRRQRDEPVRDVRGPGQRIARRSGKMLMGV